jgi:hypothetical protein
MQMTLNPFDIQNWGAAQAPAYYPLNAPDHLTPPAVLRNYGDILHDLPDMQALRSFDESAGTPVLATMEFGETVGVPRSFLRRVTGVLAEPVTRVSHALDRLPLMTHPGYSKAVWAQWLLGVAGLNVPSDVPRDVMVSLLSRSDELFPLARPAALFAAAECALGRASYAVTAETGSNWVHTTLTFLGGETLRVSEIQNASSADIGVSNKALLLEVSVTTPDWCIRLLNQLLGGFFSATVKPALTSADELLLGVTL